MSVLELLVRTKEILSSPSKWVKSKLHASGGYCLVGALQFAAKGQIYDEDSQLGWIYNQARVRCQLAIWEAENGQEWDPQCFDVDVGDLPNIPSWNDDDDRQHADILACLERAIKLDHKVVASMEDQS